jgi:hypothetical protein
MVQRGSQAVHHNDTICVFRVHLPISALNSFLSCNATRLATRTETIRDRGLPSHGRSAFNRSNHRAQTTGWPAVGPGKLAVHLATISQYGG